ncbi:MAG: hypothetical protein HKN62_06400 [Phycisphaerales bacterium]|nr:hypothetical protein [Phycisphaerales bacterium]
MRKLTTVLALGCMALLAQPGQACDEAKAAALAGKAQCGVTATAIASTDCPIESAMGSLAAAMEAMNAAQTDVPGREHVIAAALQLSKMKPDAAKVHFAKFAGSGDCSSLKTRTAVASIKSGECSSAKPVVAKVNQSDCSSPCGTKAKTVVANVKSGDCSSKQAKAVVANVKSGDCSSKQAKTVVANVKSGDCSSKQAKAVVANVKSGDCSSKQAKAVVANVKSGDCSSPCGTKAKTVVANVKSGDCSSKQAKAVVANVKSGDCSSKQAKAVVANVKSGDCATACAEACATACEGKAKAVVANVKSGDCATACAEACATACEGKAKAVVANVKSGDCASSCKGEKARNVVANVKSGEGCCDSSKAKAIVANVKSGECSSAKDVKFVAYGCEKSDAVAQAAAKAYLEVMHAIQTVAGQEGCPSDTAHKVLTAVVERIQAEYAAQAKADAPAATPATVSFGALGEKKSGSSCSSKN